MIYQLACSLAFLLIQSSTCITPAENSEYFHGFFSQYGRQPTDGTIAYRQGTGQLPEDMGEYDGVIATSDCDRVGQDAWITIGSSEWLRVIVFDCAGHAQTVSWMEESHILGEIGFYLAEEYDIIGSSIYGRLTFEEPVELWKKSWWQP